MQLQLLLTYLRRRCAVGEYNADDTLSARRVRISRHASIHLIALVRRGTDNYLHTCLAPHAFRLAIAPEFFYRSYMCLFYFCSGLLLRGLLPILLLGEQKHDGCEQFA